MDRWYDKEPPVRREEELPKIADRLEPISRPWMYRPGTCAVPKWTNGHLLSSPSVPAAGMQLFGTLVSPGTNFVDNDTFFLFSDPPLRNWVDEKAVKEESCPLR